MITHGSLFSGIGGIDLGFERAGIETIWQCEIDEHAGKVLSKRFPGIPNYKDVREVKNDGTIRKPDIISGGFPCQDVSLAGRRAGLAGARSGLWFEYQRIIDEFQPSWVVAENVPGLLSSNEGNDFRTVIGALEERGYCVAWRVLDAQYFGVAQRRRRVFIVGSLGNIGSAKVLFEREGLQGYSPKSRETGKENTESTVPCLTKNGDAHSGFRDHNGLVHGYRMRAFGDYADDGTSSALKKRDHKDATDLVCYENYGLSAYREGCGTLRKSGADNGGSSENLICYDIHQNDDGRKDRPNGGLYINETDKSLTLSRGQGKSKTVVMRSSVRRLTPIECERLQGFPDGWTDEQADTHRYQQLGNAVCVNVAEWIGKRIVEAEA